MRAALPYEKGRESICPRGPIPLAETMGMPDLPITPASDEVRPPFGLLDLQRRNRRDHLKLGNLLGIQLKHVVDVRGLSRAPGVEAAIALIHFPNAFDRRLGDRRNLVMFATRALHGFVLL